jgi:GT2 family glycosyltransferase
MALEESHPETGPGSSSGPDDTLVVLVARDESPEALEAFARAQASIQAQSGTPVTAVVVAPPGSGALRDLAAEHAVPVVDDPGEGIAAAVEAGMATAAEQHRYLCWLTPDDELLPGALAVAAATLQGSPRAVVAYGDCRVVEADEDYLCTPHAAPPSPWRLLALAPDLPRSAVLIRVSAWRAVGGLDPTLRYATDLDLLLRLRAHGEFVSTGRTLCVFHTPVRPASPAEIAAVMAEVASVRRRYLPSPLRPAARVLDIPQRMLASRVSSVRRRAAGSGGL